MYNAFESVTTNMSISPNGWGDAPRDEVDVCSCHSCNTRLSDDDALLAYRWRSNLYNEETLNVVGPYIPSSVEKVYLCNWCMEEVQEFCDKIMEDDE